MSNSTWKQRFAPATTLTHGWNAMTYTVPAGTAGPLQAVGIRLNDGPGYAGPVYLDDVAW